MIPAVMLAVFAFSAAQAQTLYSNNFNGSSGDEAFGTNISSTSGFTGGSVGTGINCSGGAYYTSSGTTYTYTLTLTADPGHQFTVTEVRSKMRREATLTGSNASVSLSVDGNAWTSVSGIGAGSCSNVNATGSEGPVNSLTIIWTGTRPALALGRADVALDDVEIIGTMTTTCTPPSTQGLVNNGPLCTTSSSLATVTLSGSESGVTYELLNSSSSVVSTLVSTTTGVQSFTNTVPAGTYSVRAYVTGNTACSTAVVGSTTVASITTPTVAFETVQNNGPICLGARAEWYITGTPGASVNYTVAGGAQQNVVLNATTGKGIIEYTNTGTAGTVTVNLVSATLNSCSNNLNPQPTSTVTVRPALTVTGITAAQTICSGGTFTNVGYTVNGTGHPRTIYYTLLPAGGGTPTTGSFNLTTTESAISTTNAKAIPVGSFTTTNTGTASIVHTVRIDSVKYTDGTTGCVEVLGGSGHTRTLTVKPNPTFTFFLNGDTLDVQPATNYICVPVGSATLSIATPNPGQYTVVKDGVTLGSGSVSSGTSSLLPGVNFDLGGNYVVTLTSTSGASQGCSTTLNYKVVEVPKASFTYTINGKPVTNGSVINVCEGTNNANFSLSGQTGATYTATGTGAIASGSILSAGSNWPRTLATGTYTGTLTVGSVPGLPGCDTTITYTVNVTPNPVITNKVKFNSSNVANGANLRICENENVTITIEGTPGNFVEIWRNEGTTANFTTVGSQVGTFVIPPSGTYTYSFNAGPWATNHEATTNFRDWFRIEIKNQATLCASSIDFNLKIEQKPRVTLSYFEGPSPITATSGAAIADGDTVRVCYPTNFRVFFNRDGSNHTSYGNIDYVYTKGITTAATGTITTTQAAGDNYYEIPVVAGAEGWYTLKATYSNGCDSSVRFYLKPNSKPVYTFYKTGTTTTPGTGGASRITFCEGYATGVTLTGSGSLTQKYTITRTSGSGSAVNFSGSLTGGTVTHVFDGLAPGTHNYTLTVTSNTDPNACVATSNFTVVVTDMPKPVLQANGITQTHGSTYEYCEGEVVEYTISALPVGSNYTLTRTNHLGTFVIGTGGTVANQASVVTVVSDSTNAGTYTLKVTNSGTDVCDSTIEFTVIVNDRPDLTKISQSGMLSCYGDASGWIRYSYNGVADSFFTYIKNRTTGDTVQIHRSNLQSQTNIQHSNLPAGDYRLTLTTNKGCDTSFNFTITQPATKVDVEVTSVTTACNDKKEGEVVFKVSGGTVPNYHVKVVNVATNAIASDFTQPAAFSNYTVDKLPAGKYAVQVWDANGCYDVDTFDIVGCASPDLVPFAGSLSLNTSIENGPDPAFSLDLYNIGQTATTGNVVVTVSLPTGFSLTGVTGWTVTQSGSTFILTSTPSIAAGGNLNIGGTISKTGTPAEGFFAVVVNVVGGSGGEVNASNNGLVYLFNVNK